MLALPRNEKDALLWRAGVPSGKVASLEAGGYLNNIISPPWVVNEFPRRLPSWGVSLGNTTNTVSTNTRHRKYKIQRDAIYALEGMNMRVDSCLRALRQEVKILRGAEGHAHFSGVMVCGSVWVCPVCASRIGEGRRQELTKALQRGGFLPVLVTVTLQHTRGDPLADLINALNTSLRKLKAGREWGNFVSKYGVLAYVSSMEVTHSRDAGWHPHKHILFFLRGSVDLEAFRNDITGRYIKLVEKCGRYASEFHAIDVRSGNDEAGSYISKWGVVSELVSGSGKETRKAGGYTPWGLAELSTSESWAREAFREYARATFGKRAITYSRGAREILGLGTEQDDQELAEGELIVAIRRDIWETVRRRGMIGNLLQVAELGGDPAVQSFLQEVVTGGSP